MRVSSERPSGGGPGDTIEAWLDNDQALQASIRDGSPVFDGVDMAAGFAMLRTRRLAGVVLDRRGRILARNDNFTRRFGDEVPEPEAAAQALAERRARIAFRTTDEDAAAPAIVYAPVEVAREWSVPDDLRADLSRPDAATVGLAIAGIDGGDALQDACRAFGLTPLQTRVAAGLVRTGHMRGAARDAGVSYETARSVFADVLKRVGATKQTGLIERLVGLSFGVWPEGRDHASVIADVWGLSPRQAALALRLAEGQTRNEAARATGVSESTAKKDIDIVFATLGVRTSAALARVVTEARGLALLAEATHNDVLVGCEFLEPLGLFSRPDGSQVAYSDYGPRSGEPVLVLHSSSSSRPVPMALVHALQAQGFRPLSIDRPGFGLTDPVADRAAHRRDPFAGAVPDVALLCEHLRLPRLDVIARGGAQVAAAMARLRPDLMGRVVLVNPDPPTRDRGGSGPLSMVKEAFVRRPELIEALAKMWVTYLSRGQIDRLMARVVRDSPPDAALMADPAALADYARGYRMFLTGRIAGYVDEQTAMTRWTTPPIAGVGHWRMLQGEHDGLHGIEDTVDFWRSSLPGLAVELVPDGGRFLAMTHPELVARTLAGAAFGQVAAA